MENTPLATKQDTTDISAVERIINQQVAAYELRLAGMDLRGLRIEAAETGVRCKRNAKAPIVEALVTCRRHILEHEAEVAALEALPDLLLDSGERAAIYAREERDLGQRGTLNGSRAFSVMR